METAKTTTTSTYAPRMVCRAIGATAVTLRSWHNMGGLRSEGPIEGDGNARRRAYTFEDALAAAVMSRLIRRGLDRRHAAEIVNDHRQYFGMPLAWLTVALGQSPEEFYGADPHRKTEDRDLWRMPGRISWQVQNSAPQLQDLFRTDLTTCAAPEDVIVLAVHEIAADLCRKLRAIGTA